MYRAGFDGTPYAYRAARYGTGPASPIQIQERDMGYTDVSVTVSAQLSDHADSRDAEDEALWEELRGKLEALSQDKRFAGLGIVVH